MNEFGLTHPTTTFGHIRIMWATFFAKVRDIIAPFGLFDVLTLQQK